MYTLLVNITSALRLGFSVASAELMNSCSTIEARPISVCQALRQATAAARTWGCRGNDEPIRLYVCIDILLVNWMDQQEFIC